MFIKNALTIAIILLASLISIKSLSQSDETLEYSDSKPVTIFIIPKEEIIKKYFIEIENDCKKSPLFAPKDEFETITQYQNRTKV